MTEPLSEVLRQSVGDVLEKMFFVRDLGEAVEAAAPAPCGLAARLAFEGMPSGWLALQISQNAAQSISADFLGKDEWEVTPAEVGEVVCELANMICGSVLSRVESGATFRLAHPRLEEMPAEGAEDDRAPTVYRMAIGDGMLTVALRMETPVWTTAARSAS